MRTSVRTDRSGTRKLASLQELSWHIPMVALLLLSIVPVLFALTYSFKFMSDIYAGAGILEGGFTFDNYRQIQEMLPLLRIFGNTLTIAVTVTAFKLITSTLAAYAFAFFDFRGKTVLYFVMISTIFIPFTMTMIPNYITISNMRLFDQVWGVVLPQLADASGIFLLRQTMLSIPRSLTEIAQLDDIGRMRTLKDIILPICRPSITATGIIFFINSWNEYVWPWLILRSRENFTLSLAMQLFSDAEAGTNFTTTMAMAVVSMFLPVVLFLIFQRYIMSTFASSGIKG